MKRAATASLFVLLVAQACAKPPAAPHSVHRVVSLAPNITELMFATNCEGEVIGTDSFSDYPAAAAKLPKVGGVEPDMEKIVALRPDLVIASASSVHPNLRRALSSARVPLLVVKTERLGDVATAMITIGRSAPCDPRRAYGTFNRAIEDSRRFRARSPRVLFVVWPDPLYIAGRQTFMDDLFVLTGAQNAAEVTGWPQYSLESLIAHPPDILLYPNRSVTADAVRQLLGRAHLPIEAIAVDENVFTRPGPRLTEAAAEMNTILDRWERTH